MKKVIFEIAGKKYRLKENEESQWTPERVAEALTQTIKELISMYNSKDLNYMVYSDLVEAARVLKKIIKGCKKVFD